MFKQLLSALVIATLAIAPIQFTQAKTTSPRTANYFLLSGTTLENPETVRRLAAFDLIVIPAEAQEYNRVFFTQIRALNPDIKILAYVPTVSWNHAFWVDPLHTRQRQGVRDHFWLTDAAGNRTSIWPNTSALNLHTGWVDELARFTATDVLASGLWDGVFYDEFVDSIDWAGPIDTDRDGQNDTPAEANARWTDGYERLLRLTRERVGSGPIIITNGSSNPRFSRYTNGRMFENFPSTGDSLLYWIDQTAQYLRLGNEVTTPPVLVINVNTSNTGDKNNYQRVRFGLTTTLLSDGYFSFDFGDQNHAQLWHYDEYNAFLGTAKGPAENVLNPTNPHIGRSVWERDFEQGKILVNATPDQQTITLDGDYEKLHGQQDPHINDGSIVSRVTLRGQDGLVLLRPIETLLNARFQNGSFARIFNERGQTERTGFFAYESAVRGGTQLIRLPSDELIVAGNTFVQVFKKGALSHQFAPFGPTYTGGINLAVDDLEKDGTMDIVTGQRSGGTRVVVSDHSGRVKHTVDAYHPTFKGGVHVATGDIDGDGVLEIITGAGAGGGPHVRVFNHEGSLMHPGFFAYHDQFRGGVHVASGDIDGDGVDEIVTGAGPTGGPHVRVFNKDAQLLRQFMAFDPSNSSGVDVTLSDVDSDGIEEIIGLSTGVFTFSFDE